MYQSGFTKHVDMMCSMLRGRNQKKNLIVVAVSSPYDFAMDKSIGTYLCTFDFTDNALDALVRTLVGAITPKGSLPGTLRKSRKVLKSRQHWLVDKYDPSRDAAGLEELLLSVYQSAPELQCLRTTTAATFNLNDKNINIDEAHFVVRNSSTGALYGFAATYFLQGVGILGTIFVDPGKRGVSVGRSLHRRAMKSLMSRDGIQKVQLGTGFPGVFPGIPVENVGANAVKDWFATSGWDTHFPRRISTLVIKDLASWTAPEGLLPSIQRANISFDLIHGLDNSETVYTHVKAHANPEVVELYRFALAETKACGIVRAKDPVGNLLGTVIICRQNSPLATYVPPLVSRTEEIGGILAPVVPMAALSSLVLQGLALMGVRQNKSFKATKSVLGWVSPTRAQVLALANRRPGCRQGGGTSDGYGIRDAAGL